MNLISEAKWERWLKATAAGTDSAAVASAAIDTGTASRAVVSAEIGTVSEGGKLEITVAESDSATGTFATVAAMPAAVATSDTSLVMDVPLTKRYIKISYQRTVANVALDSGMLLTYSGKNVPPDQPAGLMKIVK